MLKIFVVALLAATVVYGATLDRDAQAAWESHAVRLLLKILIIRIFEFKNCLTNCRQNTEFRPLI